MAFRRQALRALALATWQPPLASLSQLSDRIAPVVTPQLINLLQHRSAITIAAACTTDVVHHGFSPVACGTCAGQVPWTATGADRGGQEAVSARYYSTDARARRLAQTHERAKRLAAARAAAERRVAVTPREVVEPAETTASTSQVAQVVSHPALVVTRNVEWGTVLLGFEQANQYTVYNERGEVVALLAEDMGGIGKSIGRQLLRTRRSFTATVFSPDGSQVIFRVRRPMYLINSTMYIEDGQGNTIGEVVQRWHLWRRNYDLYLDHRQFATIAGRFLAWDFMLTDEKGGPLALIDRNFQGFGKELFTDAGKYVIHFGDRPQAAAEQVHNTIAAAHPQHATPPVTQLTKWRNPDMLVLPTATGDQLAVARPLALDERMAVLAAAISIDYDFFSRHSQGSGLLGMHMPMVPIPMPGGGGEAAGEAAGAAGPAADAGAGAPPPPPPPGGDAGAGRESPGGGGEGGLGGEDLGGDGFKPDDFGGETLEDGGGWGGGDGGSDGDSGGGLWETVKGLWDMYNED